MTPIWDATWVDWLIVVGCTVGAYGCGYYGMRATIDLWKMRPAKPVEVVIKEDVREVPVFPMVLPKPHRARTPYLLDGWHNGTTTRKYAWGGQVVRVVNGDDMWVEEW